MGEEFGALGVYVEFVGDARDSVDSADCWL